MMTGVDLGASLGTSAESGADLSVDLGAEPSTEPSARSSTESNVGTDHIQLYGTADDSIVDGPGIRFAVFTQGCKHSCPGCHNPTAQPFGGGTPVTTDALWAKVENNPLLAGITLTGGEPFEQAEALIDLARRARAKGLTVWAFTGYLYEELTAGVPTVAASRLLEQVDVLVDGPYQEELRSLDLLWRGSSNQRLIDVPASLVVGQAVEFVQL
ncbi:MAG: anaerobic ribonucleoside-triphosphate reductase activating protein [Coriobacteriales bacterium]|jgi:anaerobic ribonucleoside-triphosphate reductase activating protein|nr:anaerobic ribonucleoside-triphosphate reductase activating protein [Coriobacteriales bacterium]